jgi:hypothetical protein
MKISTPILAVLCALSSSAGAASLAPERKAERNVLVSQENPRVRITLPTQAQHVGAHRWVLYDVADCELHVFVEANKQQKIERLYWIQFEGYIPSRPESRYDYSRDGTTTIAGKEFFVRPRFGETQEKGKPGSDLEQVQRLLRENGYTLPDHMVNTRFVHLFNDRRKELMIIYAEDMAPLGLTTQQLLPGGTAEERWPEISKQVVESAKSRIALEW